MAAVVGLAMVFAALLIGRAAKICAPLEPPPFWAGDNMVAYVVLPGIVSLFAGGTAEVAAWALGGAWRADGLEAALGFAADFAVFVVLWRLLGAWARRVPHMRTS